MKRLCVKKLPPILAIQLKRFEYDFERVCAIKFNDYFEFPRDLDMEPYTVSGLAKLEGEIIDCDYMEANSDTCTKYQLSGIVVHSGQASGGHYYSYILHRYIQYCPSFEPYNLSYKSKSYWMLQTKWWFSKVVQVWRRGCHGMQDGRGRGNEIAMFRRWLHGRSFWSYVETHELPATKTLVECVHALLHSTWRWTQFSC